MGSERNGVVEFDSFRIELENRLLLKNGEVVALAPKTFDLLAALVQNRGTVLDKETLFRKVWPDVFVEESSLTKNISLLRRCLGDDPDGRAYIQTLPRRGYRFQASLGQVRTRPVEDTILEEETTEVVIESEESATRFSRAKWLWGAVAVLAGAVVLLAWIMGRSCARVTLKGMTA